MKRKILIVTALIVFCCALVTPGNAYAATRVTIFISFGIVVGGASIFFSFAYSEGYSLKKNSDDREVIYVSAFDPVKFQDSQTLIDDDSDAVGMLKLLSW